MFTEKIYLQFGYAPSGVSQNNYTTLSFGIIGEYLARMHFRTMDKPQYVELDVEKSN